MFVDYYFSRYSVIRGSFFASLTVNSASLGRGAMPLKPVFSTKSMSMVLRLSGVHFAILSNVSTPAS